MQDLATSPHIGGDIRGGCSDQSRRKLANFIMFFEGGNYSSYNCGDNTIVSQMFGKSKSIATDTKRVHSDFVLLPPNRSVDLRRRDADLTSTRSIATAQSLNEPLAMTTAHLGVAPKPAPRKSLANQHVSRSSGLLPATVEQTTNRVATLKRELFSSKQQSAKFQKVSTLNKTKELTLITSIDNKITLRQHSAHLGNREQKLDPRKIVPTSRHNELGTQQPVAQSKNEEDINDMSTDDDGETTEDSTDTKLDKPKPGKLDLRQFDNITTAIGKLNVTPSSSSPTPNIVTSTSPTTTITATSSSSKHQSDSVAPNARRLNNLRQNHGRAVAPPKLPKNMLFKNSHRTETNEITNQSQKARYNDDESAIDFTQSPIARRLLKHSKDHKVSEINSPCESDSEPQHTARARNYTALKGTNNERVPFNRVSSLESSDLISSRGETMRQLNEILAKKPPGHPGAVKPRLNKASSNDQLTDDSKQQSSVTSKKDDKDSKKDRKKLRSDEKLEKRKLKEEERLRRQEEEKQRRQEKKLAGKKPKSGSTNPNSIGEDGVPLFIKRCIEFIESEGLDAEGIYRVPGNRAHVDSFVQKFKDNPDMSILESDIPVNAVATALKDFLSKKWGPIIPLNQMNELTELSNIPDKERRVEAVRDLIHNLPSPNYKLLKYLFSHFVKVSLNNSLNSMDSKNLAICWWPTLLPLHFDDMVMFEQMRPHLEESIQTMIDQYTFIFDDEEQDPITT